MSHIQATLTGCHTSNPPQLRLAPHRSHHTHTNSFIISLNLLIGSVSLQPDYLFLYPISPASSKQHSKMVTSSSSSKSLPALSLIDTAKLKAKDGREIEAKSLWQSSPVFIYCIRRPGWCVIHLLFGVVAAEAGSCCSQLVCNCPVCLCASSTCSVLCRDEAQKLWAERAALEAVGLKVVCVVHEWIEREVGECLR